MFRAFLALVLLPAFVHAQPLITGALSPTRFTPTSEELGALQYRYVEVDAEAIGSRTTLNLFDGTALDARLQPALGQADRQMWTGQIADDPLSLVIVAVQPDGGIYLKAETTDRLFEIRALDARAHVVTERTPLDINEGDDAVEIGEPSPGKASVCDAGSTCGPQVVDVLVVYTASAETKIGSQAATESAIAAGIAEANLTNQNAGVIHSFRLAAALKTSYAESGSVSTDLGRLATAGDGFADDALVWRDQYGADLVSLLTDTGGCGIGYVPSNPNNIGPGVGFSVADDACFRFNKTFIHEMGHNMGLHHDWFVNSRTTPCAWHHGYVNQAVIPSGQPTGDRWRTVMAYNNHCSANGFNCSRLAYWSNPSNTLTGDPMGVVRTSSTNPADAAYGLNRTICVVANFRTPPAASVAVSARLQGVEARQSGTLPVPLAQPYNSAPWNYTGTESVGSVPAGAEDWVLVEIRTGTDPVTQIARAAGFLMNDGRIVQVDGTSALSFAVPAGSYHVAIYHRNHVPVVSSTPIAMGTATSASYDFTTAQAQADGPEAMVSTPNGWALWGGDADADTQTTPLDALSSWLPAQNTTGYLAPDFDLNGTVDALDLLNVWLLSHGR